MVIGFIKLSDNAEMPTRAHDTDAGADLYCADEGYLLDPGERALFGTGIAIALPEGFVGLVCPRSGLATNKGITVLNAPGVIDAGYRGEIMINLINTSPSRQYIDRGDKIAQLLIQRVETPGFVEVANFASNTQRGNKGHGSTG